MAVERLEITTRRPLAGGHAFGKVGPYEQLIGKAYFAVDPQHPLNQCIADIAFAQKGGDGLVHFSADFSILRPVNPTLGNRRLFLGVPNRGRKVALGFNFSPAGPEPEEGPDPGDGFLMEQGYTIAECGWELGVLAGRGQLTIDLPEAIGPNGPISGKVFLAWQPNRPSSHLPLFEAVVGNVAPYPTADLDDPEATLTVRDYQFSSRQVIKRSLWQFAKLEEGRLVPDHNNIYLSSGFEAGRIYELVYHARGAPVIGLGLLAVRDFASFLRYEQANGNNPCAGTLDLAYGYGISQTGRFLRHMLYLGLNEDEKERIVFDGVLPRIAGNRRGQFNQRFGVAAHLTLTGPENLFPFADEVQTDPSTGQTDGLLSCLERRGKVPKIIYANSATEYWTGGTSLTHTDVQGVRDISLPAHVRSYLFAGTMHGIGTLPLTDVNAAGDRARYSLNSLDYTPLLRAALVNLDLWVSQGIEPPQSRYSHIADGSAVPPASLKSIFSAIPGVSFPEQLPQIRRLDFGPQWSEGVATTLPPEAGPLYGNLVSAVDEDGNEIAGIRLPDLTVPLGTYTGWNQRHQDRGGEQELVQLSGSTFPFPRNEEERRALGDPRRSIAERYSSKDEYLERFRKATEDLVEARYLLAGDIERMMRQAALRYDQFTAKEGKS